MLKWFLGLREPQTDPSFAKEARGVSVLLHSVFHSVSSAHTPQAWGNEWEVVSRDIPLVIMKKQAHHIKCYLYWQMNDTDEDVV